MNGSSLSRPQPIEINESVKNESNVQLAHVLLDKGNLEVNLRNLMDIRLKCAGRQAYRA